MTWNAPLPDWNSSRTGSSVALLNDGEVTPDVANRWSCSSALTVPSSITAFLPSSLRILPPALGGQGVVEHHQALVLGAHGEHLVGLALALEVLATVIISSQVFGGSGTRSLRYQSSCTLVFFGAP